MPFTGPCEDRLAIRELLETYADAVTRADAAAWGDTWAEDGEWSMPDYPEFPTTTGRREIVALWVEAMKS
ncbi:MAG: nuclear transport factor 2 family protein, partial [Novosphingobium sp.]|nr:nuclear transport factor 2 family protein [Novosphingobium sp.]